MGLAISIMMLFFGLTSCALAQMSQPESYRGQVVDIDNGKPLANVLAVFIWERRVYSPATKRVHTEFHAATEVFTDTNGRFEVLAPSETELGPNVVEIRRQDPVFFAPGYSLWPKVETKGKPLRDPTVVYLQRINNPQIERQNLNIFSPLFPFSRTPLLLKAFNAERARLGLPPIQPGKERKGQ